MKNNKVGIVITTFNRNELLAKAVESITTNLRPEDYELIIVDQNASTDKAKLYAEKFNYYSVGFNSGLSYGRNFGVEQAKELGCEYVLIASDSFLCNNTLRELNYCKELMERESLDCLGFELNNCPCGWEAFFIFRCYRIHIRLY